MNKKTILTALASAIILPFAISCNNDNNTETIDKGKVDIAKGIEFKVDFADYNDNGEVNVTRVGKKEAQLESHMIDLGNGVLAQYTLQRDSTKQVTTRATSPLVDDTYTMLAYDNATHAYKGEMTGTVTSGVFTPTSARILLAPGNYDFVLYNSKVSRSGNNLTVTRTNADAALIGRTTQTITATPNKQYVSFSMKHVNAKVKIKLTSYMDFNSINATLVSVNSTGTPSSSIYDASTGAINMGSGASFSANMTYNASTEPQYYSKTYTSTSNEDAIFMGGTDVSNLKLTFTSGNIYKHNMAGASLILKPTSTLKLDPNGAYTLNVKLMYNFLYLMSDGTTGTFIETTYGGGTKVPIGVVVSQSKRLAVALKDALGGAKVSWDTQGNILSHVPGNYKSYEMSNILDMYNDMDGYKYTWEASGSYDHITIKANSSNFPAFWYAAHHGVGVPTAGNIGKWFLPSEGQWKYFFTALTLGDASVLNAYGQYVRTYPYLADQAFTQVGGDSMYNNNSSWDSSSKIYWSSSEYYNGGYPGHIALVPGTFWFLNFKQKSESCYVRSFVQY